MRGHDSCKREKEFQKHIWRYGRSGGKHIAHVVFTTFPTHPAVCPALANTTFILTSAQKTAKLPVLSKLHASKTSSLILPLNILSSNLLLILLSCDGPNVLPVDAFIMLLTHHRSRDLPQRAIHTPQSLNWLPNCLSFQCTLICSNLHPKPL